MGRTIIEMLCAYCGHKTKSPKAVWPTDSFELQSPNLTFGACDHERDLEGLKASDYPQYLKTLFEMVSQQMKAIAEIEAILAQKKGVLQTRIQEYVGGSLAQLDGAIRHATNFQINFSKLTMMKVPPRLAPLINGNPNSFFDKVKLVAWADKCLRNSMRIQRKIQALDKEFYSEFEAQLRADTDALSDTAKSVQSRFTVHQRLLETDVTAPGQDPHLLKTIEDIFERLNADAKVLIRDKSERVNALLKKTNTKLTQSLYLLAENLTELMADVKVISIFDTIETVVTSCLEEMARRAKFEAVYKGVVGSLNGYTQRENERRTRFVAEWGEQIPSQIFPDVRDKAKLLNEGLFFADGYARRMGDDALSDGDRDRLHAVSEALQALG